MKYRHFLWMGIIAAFSSDKIINDFSPLEATHLFQVVQSRESLPVDVYAVRDNYIDSFVRLQKGDSTERTPVNLGIGTSNIIKIFSPLNFLKSSTRGFYEFVALHEFAHAQLNHMIIEKEQIFRLQNSPGHLDNVSNKKLYDFSERQLKIINQSMNYFLHENLFRPNALVANFHENFADVYASVLMIRHMKQYSDKNILDILRSRHGQVKKQLFSVGDIAHRTHESLKTVLESDFETIRNMTPEDAKAYSLQVASHGFSSNFKERLPALFKASNKPTVTPQHKKNQ